MKFISTWLIPYAGLLHLPISVNRFKLVSQHKCYTSFDLRSLQYQYQCWKCSGSDHIHISNDTGLTITHFSTSMFSTPEFFFSLHNVLHVSQITKNIIYVQRFVAAINTFYEFITAINTFYEFHPSFFFAKDWAMGNTILHRPSKNGLYSFPALN